MRRLFFAIYFVYFVYFLARLLSRLESCHCIGYDADTDSTAANTMVKLIQLVIQQENKHHTPQIQIAFSTGRISTEKPG